MNVRNIMVTELVTLHVDEELSLASDIMNLARIRHLGCHGKGSNHRGAGYGCPGGGKDYVGEKDRLLAGG